MRLLMGEVVEAASHTMVPDTGSVGAGAVVPPQKGAQKKPLTVNCIVIGMACAAPAAKSRRANAATEVRKLPVVRFLMAPTMVQNTKQWRRAPQDSCAVEDVRFCQGNGR